MKRVLLVQVVLVTTAAHLAFAQGVSAQSEGTTGANSQKGRTLVERRCRVCHSINGSNTGVGPELTGVFGRRSAATQYDYSPAMRNARLTWDESTLTAFLAAPSKMIPGTKMPISVADATDRANIIAFLKDLR